MKIFSLQSKWSLLGWSFVSGYVLNNLAYRFLVTSGKNCSNLLAGDYMHCQIPPKTGFPIQTSMIAFNNQFLINLAFWILISLVALSLFKYFKSRH